MIRDISLGFDVCQKLLKGALQLAKAVSVTYGPHGRTAIIERFAGLLTTKDGVSLARELSFPDPIENLGCQLLKQACIKVNDEVGDGTTTTAILTAEILQRAHKLTAGGFDPSFVVKGLRIGKDMALDAVRQISIPVETREDIERVALIAGNYDKDIAEHLAEACMAVGKDGVISIEDGPGVETRLVLKDGMEIPSGMASPYFAAIRDDGKLERVIEGALVAVINSRLSSVDDVQSVMETASQWPDNHLVIFCLGFGPQDQALATMILNDSRNVVKCCAVEIPGIGRNKTDVLEDISALSGADFVDARAGYDIRKWNADWFGSARKITITGDKTLLEAYPEASVSITERINRLKTDLRQSGSEYDQDRIKERIAKLSGGIAVLKIGEFTEAALKERRARVEDALASVKASLRHGMVPGGGAAYLRASMSLEDGSAPENHVIGIRLLRDSLKKPLAVLAFNAGQNGNRLVRAVREKSNDPKSWVGWDALRDEIRNLGDDPIIVDPAQVVISAIETAVSVAATILTVEASITAKR